MIQMKIDGDLCQHPFCTSSESPRRGLSSALISLLGEDGAVSDSDQAFELPGLLEEAVLGLLMASAVDGRDFPVPGREDFIPVDGLLFPSPDAGLLSVELDEGLLLLLEGRLEVA